MNANEKILLGHGGGGTLTGDLIKNIIMRHLDNPILARLDDGACLTIPEKDIVFTTDSYVIHPIFFPGGDIGKLAVCGTVNDLAMQGARPKYLSLGLILEEGLAIRDLERIIASAAGVLNETGVQVVTGDTKVVERGSGWGIFINTSGIGVRVADVGVANARPGDVVILTGTMGDHGTAVMSRREGLEFETEIVSDVASLCGLTEALLEAVPSTKVLRDPTRGGVAAAVCDIAAKSDVGINLDEKSLPIKSAVRGACDLLGLDTLNVANEGKAIVVVAEAEATRALEALRAHPLGREACVIGKVVEDHPGMVLLETLIGGERIVDIPAGEDLPRIC